MKGTAEYPTQAPRAVLCMGTGAPQLVSGNYYRQILDTLAPTSASVEAYSLHKLGLGDFVATVDDMEDRVFGSGASRPVVLVGHSQGSSVVHWLAHRHPDEVSLVIELSPPTHGTWLANLPVVGRLGLVPHLALHSDEMRHLRGLKEFPHDRIHTFYTPFDQFVVPWVSSIVEGAHNTLVAPRLMHAGLVRLAQQRRSLGIQVMHGYCDHVTIVRCRPVLARVQDILAAAPSPN